MNREPLFDRVNPLLATLHGRAPRSLAEHRGTR